MIHFYDTVYKQLLLALCIRSVEPRPFPSSHRDITVLKSYYSHTLIRSHVLANTV